MTVTDLDLRIRRDVADALDGDDWRSLAACRDEDPELFYLPTGARTRAPATLARVAAAKAVCAACPVTSECLRWALDTADAFGVLGATTPDERRAMRLAQRPGDEPGA